MAAEEEKIYPIPICDILKLIEFFFGDFIEKKKTTSIKLEIKCLSKNICKMFYFCKVLPKISYESLKMESNGMIESLRITEQVPINYISE